MNSKETRSEAEIYRQERKERIKKDSAKTKKGTGKASRVLSKVIAIVLCVVIAGGAFWYLFDFFGWPQKLTSVATVTVEDKEVKVNVAKFNFYYMAAYNSAMSTSYQYSQYGYNYGFDYKQPADAQKKKYDDGNEITYAEKFKNDAIASLEETLYYAAKAKEAGTQLNADDRRQIDDTMDSLNQRAKSNRYSLSAYIIQMYGKGLNAKLFEEYVEEQMLASRYLSDLQEKYADEYSEEEVKAHLDEHADDYMTADYRILPFPYGSTKDSDGKEIPADYTKEEQLSRANEMVGKITDEASFATLCRQYCAAENASNYENDAYSLQKALEPSRIQSQIGEENAEWVLSAERKAGDVSVFEIDDYVLVIYIVNPRYLSDAAYVQVRHLLVKDPDEASASAAPTEPTTNADGEEVTPETEVPETHLDDGIAYEGKKHSDAATEKIYKETPKNHEDAKRIAESYLARFNETDKTEEDFAKLADLYSDDTASTSAGSGYGGLISDMKVGQYVKPFEDWSYDSARKAGDVEIVETEFGYHLMYFIEIDDKPAWNADIRKELATEKVNKENETSKETYKGTLTANDKNMQKAVEKCLDLASTLSFG